MKEHKIYTLHDPREPEHIRYVGYTCRSLHTRLWVHVYDAKRLNKSCHKDTWIRSLLRLNIKPLIKLHKLVDEDSWSQEEIKAISYFKSLGHDLTNNSSGGEGNPSTPESRLAHSIKMKDLWINEPHRFNSFPNSPETIVNRSNARKVGSELKRQQQIEFIQKSGYDPDTYKQCNKCLKIQLKSNFRVDSSKHDKLCLYCNQCIRNYYQK